MNSENGSIRVYKIVASLLFFMFMVPFSASAIEITELRDTPVLNDFVIGPAKIELEVAPGEEASTELFVTNRLGEPRAFTVSFEEVSGSVDGTPVTLGNDPGPYSLLDNVTLRDTSFTIDHGQRASIPIQISVPSNAEPGSKHIAVFVATDVEKPDISGGEGVLPTTRPGALLFVRVPGDAATSGELREFDTFNRQHAFKASDLMSHDVRDAQIRFFITYENSGNTYVNPYGQISVSKMFKGEVTTINVEPYFVLPQAIRTREVPLRDALETGRYTATLSLNRGYDDVIDVATVSFWIISTSSVVWFIVSIVIVALLLRGMIRKPRKR